MHDTRFPSSPRALPVDQPVLPPLLLLFACVPLAGCAIAHQDEPTPPVARLISAGAPATVLRPAALESCFRRGAPLRVDLSIDNNDTMVHGDLEAIALSARGQLVVGSVDGTLKTWRLDGEFLGVQGGGLEIYGAEFLAGGTPPMALAYAPDGVHVWSVEASGRIGRWSADLAEPPLSGFPLAGDGSEIALPGTSLAVRDDGAVAATVRSADRNNFALVPPLAADAAWSARITDVGLDAANAVAAAGDRFFVGGSVERRAALVAVSAIDGAVVSIDAVALDCGACAEVSAVATSSDGAHIAVAGDDFVASFAVGHGVAVLEHLAALARAATSVAYSRDGAHLLIADVGSSLRVFSAAALAPELVEPLNNPVTVAAHPTEDALVVGRADGHVDILTCVE